MGNVEKLLKLFDSDSCDYDMCRQIINEIGGPTQIVEWKYGVKTTPLHEAMEFGHYDFAIDLIKDPRANLDVDPNGLGPLIWELQYLYAETEEEQMVESGHKLRLMRALINAGANPNPKDPDCGEELLWWIRDELNEGDGNHHLWQMEHIIEAHAHGKTDQFFTKLNEKAVRKIMLSDYGFWLIDDNLCDCDHAIVVFEDGERMALSSYQVGDDEWNFYSVSAREDITFDNNKYHVIMPENGFLKVLFSHCQEENDPSCWLDFTIDDAILRIHAADPNITVGIVGLNENDPSNRKRKKLFETDN